MPCNPARSDADRAAVFPVHVALTLLVADVERQRARVRAVGEHGAHGHDMADVKLSAMRML